MTDISPTFGLGLAIIGALWALAHGVVLIFVVEGAARAHSAPRPSGEARGIHGEQRARAPRVTSTALVPITRTGRARPGVLDPARDALGGHFLV